MPIAPAIPMSDAAMAGMSLGNVLRAAPNPIIPSTITDIPPNADKKSISAISLIAYARPIIAAATPIKVPAVAVMLPPNLLIRVIAAITPAITVMDLISSSVSRFAIALRPNERPKRPTPRPSIARPAPARDLPSAIFAATDRVRRAPARVIIPFLMSSKLTILKTRREPARIPTPRARPMKAQPSPERDPAKPARATPPARAAIIPTMVRRPFRIPSMSNLLSSQAEPARRPTARPIIMSAFERDFNLSADSSDKTLSMSTIEPIRAPRITIVAPKPTFNSSHGTRDSRYAEPAKMANAPAIFRIELPRASILAASPIDARDSLMPSNTPAIDLGRAAMSLAALPSSSIPNPPAKTPRLLSRPVRFTPSNICSALVFMDSPRSLKNPLMLALAVPNGFFRAAEAMRTSVPTFSMSLATWVSPRPSEPLPNRESQYPLIVSEKVCICLPMSVATFKVASALTSPIACSRKSVSNSSPEKAALISSQAPLMFSKPSLKEPNNSDQSMDSKMPVKRSLKKLTIAPVEDATA